MNKTLTASRALVVLALGAVVMSAGCGGLFFDDGNEDEGVQSSGGYFFLVDNETQQILMLDRHLAVRRSWPFTAFTSETFVQGVTCDDGALWVSVAGAVDAIYRLDLTAGPAPVIVRAFAAPPEGRGTVRDLAWDGAHLWALNGGSVTYATGPELFKLDPLSGTVLAQHALPSAEPRGLCYVGPNADVYGGGARVGLYYTDREDNFIYVFSPERSLWFDGFAAPVPPRSLPAGVFYIFPSGIEFDGQRFWTVNSSGPADHLFRLDANGAVQLRIDLPYERPGAVAWSPRDLTVAPAPEVFEASPNTGGPGAHKIVTLTGAGFRDGAGLAADFGAHVATDSLRFESTTRLTAFITISEDAALGPRDITVTNPDGQQGSGAALFRVVADDPSLGSLWLGDLAAGTVRRYSINDRAWVEIYDTTPISQASQQGLTFDGEKLWISFSLPDRLVARVDTAGGVLSLDRDLAARATGTVRDLAWDGQHLWVANQSTTTPAWNLIDRLDPQTGEILQTVPAPLSAGGIRGIAWADGSLYANDKDSDSVYVWLPEAERWEAVFAAPVPPGGGPDNVFPTGMAWDGTSFWLANSTGEYDYIFQLSPEGTVLSTIEVPDRGPAQPSGLVYTPRSQR